MRSYYLDFPVLDAHFHLWDTERLQYPWLAKNSARPALGDHKPLMRPYLFAEYQTMVGALLPLAGGVHVEAGCADPLAEAKFAAEQASADFELLHVAGAQMWGRDASEQIDAALGMHHVAGVRCRLNADANSQPAAHAMNDSFLLQNLARLERAGSLFELSVFPSQCDAALGLVARFPGLRFAVNHLGWPRIESGDDQVNEWRRMLRGLARHPNVMLKLSMLWPIDRRWNAEVIGPFVHEALDIFGPHRVAFGSNFPVETLMGSFVAQLESLLFCLRGLARADLEAVFRRTVAEFYRFNSKERLRDGR